MVVCKFWQQGNCRFGSNCRFEHPSRYEQSSNTVPIQNNRFGALSTTPDSSPRYNSQNRYQNGAPGGSRDRGNREPAALPYGLDKEAIYLDLTKEKPSWLLSSYGPGRQAPIQLFGGPVREQSFEEMRLLHYEGFLSGNPQAAVDHINALMKESLQQMEVATQDLDGAIRYIISGENEHPNRIDICANPGTIPNVVNPASSNTFGQPAPGNVPFGAPSNTNTNTNPFGAPAQSSPFGAPSQPAPNPFGQPAQPPQNQNPFGAPAPTSSAFGQPTQLGGGSAFGQPSQPVAGAFGQPAQLGANPNPFGAPQTSTFGQPNVPTITGFSAFSNAPSGFVQPPAANPFGQPSQPSPRPAAVSPFGQPAQPVPTANPFGATIQSPPSNPFGQPAPNPFGQPTQPASPSPFGAASPVTQNPFGQPQAQSTQSPFGAPLQTTQPNPFGQASPSAPATNLFGSQTAPAQQNPFGQPPTNNGTAPNPFGQSTSITSPANSVNADPFGAARRSSVSVQGISADKSPYAPNATLQHPDPSTYSSRDVRRQLTMFKGKQVAYKDGEPWAKNRADGKWEKVWFPDGPPAYNPTTELEDDMYDEDTKNAYLHARQTGEFPDGVMPLLPPKREWCTWDF